MILNRQITSSPNLGPSTPGSTNASRPLINRVIPKIESDEVRELVTAVFDDLLRLLDCLTLVENHLRKVESAPDTFELFQLVHDEASGLVEFIRTEALQNDLLDGELFDTLDGIAFAIRHDLQRVFEADSRPRILGKSTHAVVGKLYRAHDILTNCLQQSTITLAMLFDSGLVGATLFNNSNVRYRQSLQLCDAVTALIRHVETAESSSQETSLQNLAVGIQSFQNDSLELLMYSDWPQFESFSERIAVARNDGQDLEPILHQFRCYLETLLGQVKRRAVLANVFPIEFGNETNFQKDPFTTHIAADEDQQVAWPSLGMAM